MHPLSGHLVDARDAVGSLVEHVAAALDAAGDRALVDGPSSGSGPWAAAHAGSGRPSSAPGRWPGVVADVVARTAESAEAAG